MDKHTDSLMGFWLPNLWGFAVGLNVWIGTDHNISFGVAAFVFTVAVTQGLNLIQKAIWAAR